MARIPPNSVALAGEFAVLSQLTLRGYDASMTLGHTKNIDILVRDPKTGARYEVEVKTNLETRTRDSDSKLFGKFVTDWQMSAKHEEIQDPSLFYCFVHINASRTDPDKYAFRFFIVPSAVVARYVREEHQLWLSDNPAHQTSDRRLFRIGLPNDRQIAVPAPLASHYEDRWNFAPDSTAVGVPRGQGERLNRTPNTDARKGGARRLA
jgi:hypothetical protein